jgi:hypothetical protein
MSSTKILERNRWVGAILLIFLLLVRISSVFLPIIDDCDEVYGYWEPLHYLVFRYGSQTWEYSPKYAIRSYSFLVPMAWMIKFLRKINEWEGCPILFNQMRPSFLLCIIRVFFLYGHKRQDGSKNGNSYTSSAGMLLGIYRCGPKLSS